MPVGGFPRMAHGCLRPSISKIVCSSRCGGQYSTVVGTESEDHLPAALDKPPGPIDQILHHRLQAGALGRVAYRRIGPEQSALAHQAQDVHRERRRLAHQSIGAEFARGQPAQIQVGLELGVELFVGAMIGVQIDDRLPIQALRHAGRPAIELVVGHDQVLAAGADGALD